MIGGSYAGQSYNAQGYPVTGATLPPAGIYGFDIYGVDGQLALRIGDISGQPWGGRDFKLPPGTYGLWGQRAGVWLKGMPQVFYCNGSEETASVSGPGGPAGVWTLFIEERLPFEEILVPAGRMVTWEDFPFFTAVSITSAPGVSNPAIVAWKLDQTLFMATKDRDGSLLSWNFLTGPAVSGLTRYGAIRLRRVFKVQTSGTGSTSTWTFSIRRVSVLRMFAHEANAGATLTGVFDNFASGQTATQTPNPGEDRDPGGGEGIDLFYEGDTGDLGGVVGGGGGGSIA